MLRWVILLVVLITSGSVAAEEEDAAKSGWIEDFELGLKLYDEGSTDRAFEQWDRIPSDVAELTELRGKVDELRESRKSREAIEVSPQATTPFGLPAMLREISQRQGEEAEALFRARAGREERAVKTEWVNAEFEKAKKLAEEGKLEEAFRIWEDIIPSLDNPAEMQAILDGAKQNYAESERLKALEKNPAAALTPSRLPAAKAMIDYLEKQRLDLNKEVNDRQTDIAMASVTEKRRLTELVESEFKKGREFYEAGKIEEALNTWHALEPHVQDKVKLGTLLNSIEVAHSSLPQEKPVTATELPSEPAPVPLRPELFSYLEITGQALDLKVEEARAEKEKAIAKNEDTRRSVEEQFRKGKAAYDDGNTTLAVETWRGILPYLESPETVKNLIDKIDQHDRDMILAQRETQAALAKAREPIEPSEDHKRILEDLEKSSKTQPRPKTSDLDELMLQYKIITPEELAQRRRKP